MSRALIVAAAAVGLAVLAAPAFVRAPPGLLWNVTASAPVGLYWMHAGRSFAVGDWVAARAPASLRTLFAARRYLPAGTPLVKQIAAVSPQQVCRFGARLVIDKRVVARAQAGDRMGRRLPDWSGCRRLRLGEVFLLNATGDSLDGRYFGPSPAGDIVGRLTPLWILREADR